MLIGWEWISRRHVGVFLIITVAASVVCCSVVPHGTARNEPICPEGTAPAMESFLARGEKPCVAHGIESLPPKSPSVPRARQTFEVDDKDVSDVFVGLAISGGGSRAANFGLAVMEQLKEIGILEHVTAISTISGGGLPGAYYALKGPDMDWRKAKQLMATSFLSRWITSNLLPHNLMSTTFSHEDRSDLMADVFDATLYGHATYEKLGDFKVGTNPIWLANATDAMRGQRFTFSEVQFQRLRSALSSFPVSQAVVASAAFPGAFNTVTLRNYLPVRREPNGQWRAPLVAYEHLIDGGPTDNLGIEALLELAASHQRVTANRKSGGDSNKRCILLIADAYPSGVPSRKAWAPDPRAWYDHLADLNFLDAFDALLTRRRTDLLGYVGIREGDRTGRIPAHQFVEFDVPIALGAEAPMGQVRRVGDFTLAEMQERTNNRQLFQAIPIPPHHFRCAAWHINLSGVEAVARYVVDPSTGLAEPLIGDPQGKHPLMKHRQNLHSVVSQIKTDFKLTGLRNCSSQFLQEAIYAAAFVLVREDHQNRTRACDWFREAGLTVSGNCNAFPENRTLEVLPLDIEPDSDGLPSVRARDEAVRCKPTVTTQTLTD